MLAHRPVTALSPLLQFLKGLPAPSPGAAAGLLLTMRTPAQARTRVKAVTKRGYLGCLPFAHTKSDDLVLRLLPDVAVDDSPVAVVFADPPDAVTIAPNLRHFVAGRVARLDYCSGITKHPAAMQDEILAYADALGGGDSARAVFGLCKASSKLATNVERVGKLLSAADDVAPLFAVLSGGWSYQLKEVPAWLRTLRGKAREHPIARNIRVSYNTRFKTGEDVSEDAWAIVFGDQVFDRGYVGITRGPMQGTGKLNAVQFAVTFLRDKPTKDARFKALEWEAVQAAVDDEKYAGEAHLRAAQARTKSDPRAAYTQLANAAYYAGRAKGGKVESIVKAAYDLAKKEKWSELADVLAMSLTSK